MSQYRKPKRITITLWLMLIWLILAAFAGVIVPYLPSATDDINEMTQGIGAATTVNTNVQTRPVDADDAATFDDTPADADQPILQDDDAQLVDESQIIDASNDIIIDETTWN